MSEEIDVSGCEYYVEGNQTYNCVSDCAVTYYDYCEQNPNCYYKQMKRLEAENAMLKRHKRELGNVAQQFVKDIEKYKEENKKLKEALEEIKEMAIYDCDYECSNNSENCTIGSCLEKRIQRKINEVLKDE